MTASREVEIRIRSRKGGSAEVLALLADHQLVTLTRSSCADCDGLLLLLTASRPQEVQQVLEATGYVCQTHPVLLLGPTIYSPGVAARLLTELGQRGVDIHYSYVCGIAPDPCCVVVETTNNERAVEIVAAAA